MEQALDNPAAAHRERATREQFRSSDDKDMLRAARDLTKGLGVAKGAYYWPDLLGSVMLLFCCRTTWVSVK